MDQGDQRGCMFKHAMLCTSKCHGWRGTTISEVTFGMASEFLFGMVCIIIASKSGEGYKAIFLKRRYDHSFSSTEINETAMCLLLTARIGRHLLIAKTHVWE